MNAIPLIVGLWIAAAVPPQEEFPKPGKEHELLKQFVGEWTAECKFWMDPSQPAMEMKGTETCTLGPGGFWITSVFKGEAFGKPFEGRATTGYSPFKKKFVGTWIDSMVPHLFTTEGTIDEAGKVITFTADALDPAAGTPVKERWVIEIKGADSHVMTMYTPGPDGKEKKSGEIVYTRKK